MKRHLVLTVFFTLVLRGGFVSLGAEGLAKAVAVQADLSAKRAKWMDLNNAVKKKAAIFRGDVGLIIKDLDTGWTIQINPDEVFPSASIVKVPIMVACLKADFEGRISLQDQMKLMKSDKARGSGILRRSRSGSIYTIEQLIELMITRSDNTAANMLINLLGLDYLNGCFKEMGLEKTTLCRKMMDFRARTKGLENYTTAREMADVLEKMYHKACLGAEISEKCLEWLKSQKVNDRIPRLLPKSTVVAHKTGLERQICHDAGIVFTDNGDFLITVLTRTTRGARVAKQFIAAASSIAYKTYAGLNPGLGGFAGRARSGH